MPRPTPASRVMPIDWSTRPSSSIATHSDVKSPPRAAVLPRARPGRTARGRPSLHDRRPGSGGRGPTARRAGATSRSAKSRTTLRNGLVILGQLERDIVLPMPCTLTFTSTLRNDSTVVTPAEARTATWTGSANSPTSSASRPEPCASTRPRAWSAPTGSAPTGSTVQRDRARLRLILRGRRFGMIARRVSRDRRHVRRRRIVRATTAGDAARPIGRDCGRPAGPSGRPAAHARRGQRRGAARCRTRLAELDG